MKKALPIIISLVLIILAAAAAVYLYFDNTRIDSTEYEVKVRDLPQAFDGFRIVQISDFHNSTFGENNCRLIDAIRSAKPDIIVITGDYLDSRNTNPAITDALTEVLVKTAPVYYVTGNHEFRIPEQFSESEKNMKNSGVHVLRSGSEYIELDGQRIRIVGVDDPTFYTNGEFQGQSCDEMISDIKNLCDDSCISVLLAHRPSLFDDYAAAGADIILSGHEHGGQFRIPFVGGLFAPDEGLFPEYCDGVHRKGNSTLVVSRGLGQSVFPFRVNNSPELVTVVLRCEQQ